MFESKTLEGKLEEVSQLLDKTMQDFLPSPGEMREGVLFEAMRYAALSRGKRLRPFLTVCTANLFGIDNTSAIRTALAIEFIHSYSLVHDDLPAMDNDSFRRGQPSCHSKFGEATAILVGDALLTFAFEILSDSMIHNDSSIRIELINKLTKACGHKGLIAGQLIDLLAEDQELEFSEIIRLQRMKTGALFTISCEAGAILGRAPNHARHALKAYANNLGLAFQITDDLLDAEGTREETGKGVRKDRKAGKATLISCIGIERAREHAAILSKQAKEHLSQFGSGAKVLRDLADFVLCRTK